MRTPKDFTNHPCGSISQKCEAETVAQNIMIILERTGNKFRKLSLREYKSERLKDDNYTFMEELYFKNVSKYCISEKKALEFCKNW